MVNISINTTQNVNINFVAASVGERLLAYLIDWIIKIAYVIVVYQLMFKAFNFEDWAKDMDQWSVGAVVVFFYLPAIFYSLIFESLLDGQTPGKRIIKIKVVKIDGYQASFPDFIVRWFFRIVDLNLFSGIIGLIAVVTSNKNQRIGDMTAGTGVIALKNKVNISHTILEELKEDYTPTYPSVIKLSDNDVRIIKETYLAAKKSKDYATLIKLRAKVIEVMEIRHQVESNDMEFISTVIKDYNYYTQDM